MANITLSVDAANDSNPADVTFKKYRDDTPDKITFHETVDHTAALRDKLTLSRRPAVRNGNFLGTNKCTIKFTKDVTVAGFDGSDVIAPIIGEQSWSVPVGATDAEVIEVAQHHLALLDDDTLVTEIIVNGDIQEA